MITATLQDWLLSQPRLGAGELPHILPKVSRVDLPKLTLAMGYTKGAEIGVWKGVYTASFCEANPELHMLCVDPWEPHADWVDTKNAMEPDKARVFIAKSYEEAAARLRPYSTTIVRKYSVEAAKDVPDGSLDFCFIDANHVYEAVMADLKAWAPKVRSGGFLAGHDFREFPNKPFVQVIPAVLAYTRAHEIDPWFVLSAERTPSWLWVKR